MNTRPYNLLPLPHPRDFDPGPEYFYTNFVHPMIPDMIQLMDVGLNIDPNAVSKLRTTVTEVLENVTRTVGRNRLIRDRLETVARNQRKDAQASLRTTDDYLLEYNKDSAVHRTWIVNTRLRNIGKGDKCRESWLITPLKALNEELKDPYIMRLLLKVDISEHEETAKGMLALAEYKLSIYNTPRIASGNAMPVFNPGSAKQKQEFFSSLGLKSPVQSKKTGDCSWSREIVEDMLYSTPDGPLKDILEAFVDHSYSSIIQNNFLKAFDTYTVDGVLRGNVKLLGAKSARPTSNAPNLLNMPSTKSVYAKPLKSCFKAPEGKLVIQADFNSLEDVVLANLTLDPGKVAIQKDKSLDAHCYNALSYFQNSIEDIIGTEGDYKDKVRRFKKAVKSGDKALSDIRQNSKPCTFKLAYLGFPDADKGGVITQHIYDNYHNKLYPGVKSYLEDYTIPTVKEQGYIHLGLGFRMYTDNVDEKFRTVFNANFQFWSVLTLIAVNEMNHRIRDAGLTKDIEICGTIYDSIYANITPDAQIVQWYNKNLVEVGSKDFLEDQEIPNILTCGIGRNWAEEIDLAPDATIEEIQKVLDDLGDSDD